jgi:predicted nucleic acid-binding Zn ribbon protein
MGEPEELHDPTGLGLARSVANAIKASTRRRGRRSPPGGTPAESARSGAAPDDRDPRVLGDALERLMEAKGWTTDLGVHTLLARWAVLVGPVNAEHSRPESYADGVLTVRADSTVWASSLRAMAPQLVARLNEQLGEGTVRLVRVLGPEAPSWKRGRLSVRDGRGPRDTYG